MAHAMRAAHETLRAPQVWHTSRHLGAGTPVDAGEREADHRDKDTPEPPSAERSGMALGGMRAEGEGPALLLVLRLPILTLLFTASRESGVECTELKCASPSSRSAGSRLGGSRAPVVDLC